MNRKPLVFVNGEISEMPAGDLVDPVALPPAPAVIDASLVTMKNGTPNARPFGTPVYVKTNGDFDDAVPSDPDKAEVIGLVADASVASGADGAVKTLGVMVGTQAQWDAQTGGSGGLIAGSDYYLRSGGGLTTSPTGPHVTKIGKAINNEKLNVRIEPTVSLS